MTQIHLVLRRINPALKIDLAQIGYINDGQFKELPLSIFERLPVLSVIRDDSISDSRYIYHSDVSGLVTNLSALPGFAVEFFDNTLIFMFDFNIDSHESASKEENPGY